MTDEEKGLVRVTGAIREMLEKLHAEALRGSAEYRKGIERGIDAAFLIERHGI